MTQVVFFRCKMEVLRALDLTSIMPEDEIVGSYHSPCARRLKISERGGTWPRLKPEKSYHDGPKVLLCAGSNAY